MAVIRCCACVAVSNEWGGPEASRVLLSQTNRLPIGEPNKRSPPQPSQLGDHLSLDVFSSYILCSSILLYNSKIKYVNDLRLKEN